MPLLSTANIVYLQVINKKNISDQSEIRYLE